MPGHDVIVIGASAGGVEALSTIVGGLPADLPASIFVVLHIPAQSPSYLPNILRRRGRLPALQASDGQKIKKGHIYVAPPDCHLLVSEDVIRVVHGPKENRSRPAVDPLFRSAAEAFGPRAVGVVLTGSLDDGTLGLRAIKLGGGLAVVQDPNDALFPSMPSSALMHVDVDYVLPLEGIPALLTELAYAQVQEREFSVPEKTKLENEIVEKDLSDPAVLDRLGTASHFACPECHGTLWEMHDGNLLRFRCRVGHAYTADSMLAEHNESLEGALWAALRALEESASLSLRMAERARDQNHRHVVERFMAKANEAQANAELVRKLLMTQDELTEQPTE
ncbi:MAG: chemotaxis protein CheB [Chloroflexota bacterium]